MREFNAKRKVKGGAFAVMAAVDLLKNVKLAK